MNIPRIALPRAPAALFGRFAHPPAVPSIRPCQHLLRRQFSQTQPWSTTQEKVQTIPSYQPYPLNTTPRTPTQTRDEPIANPIPAVQETRPPPQPQTQTQTQSQASQSQSQPPSDPESQSPTTAKTSTAAEAASATNVTEREASAPAPAPPQQQQQQQQPQQQPQQRPKRKLRPRKAALKLTPTAVEKLRTLLDEPEPKLIKIGVRNRGCSGLAYHLEYVDRPGAFDEEVEQDGVKVLIDSKALFSIIGSEMDWVEDKLNQRFHFRNPNISKFLRPIDHRKFKL